MMYGSLAEIDAKMEDVDRKKSLKKPILCCIISFVVIKFHTERNSWNVRYSYLI